MDSHEIDLYLQQLRPGKTGRLSHKYPINMFDEWSVIVGQLRVNTWWPGQANYNLHRIPAIPNGRFRDWIEAYGAVTTRSVVWSGTMRVGIIITGGCREKSTVTI